MALMPEAVKRQKVLRPREFGLKKIGHLGAFKRENAVLWPAILGCPPPPAGAANRRPPASVFALHPR
jgi:hypothetical protein